MKWKPHIAPVGRSNFFVLLKGKEKFGCRETIATAENTVVQIANQLSGEVHPTDALYSADRLLHSRFSSRSIFGNR